MLKNYLLLALKILRRHRFYTCISLFGIAATLMVLIVLTSLIESFVHPQRAGAATADRFLVAGVISMINSVDAEARSAQHQHAGLPLHRKRCARTMKTPELISVFSGSIGGRAGSLKVTGFRNGVKIVSAAKRTDANYWKILQFEFLAGRPISPQEHEQGAYVAVISESTRNRYFPGRTPWARALTLDGNGTRGHRRGEGCLAAADPGRGRCLVADLRDALDAVPQRGPGPVHGVAAGPLARGPAAHQGGIPAGGEELQPIPPAWFTAGGTLQVHS